MSKRPIKKSFQDHHEAIDADPVVELRRRLQMWASCPDADGGSLTPSASIVPDETIDAVLQLIERQRHIMSRVESWWLSQGMNKFEGAPECIFALRAALSVTAGVSHGK